MSQFEMVYNPDGRFMFSLMVGTQGTVFSTGHAIVVPQIMSAVYKLL